jgi:hypothetical protein
VLRDIGQVLTEAMENILLQLTVAADKDSSYDIRDNRPSIFNPDQKMPTVTV